MVGKELQIKLPRFKVEYDKELEEDMIAMGMKDAFDAYKAKFANMSGAELYCLLQQFTYINVDEEGTKWLRLQ